MSEEDSLVATASNSKRRIGRAVSLNGVNAVEVDLKKSANLSDPILNVNVKLNNPVGRLWLAIKRIWKSQNTVIALRFTIPILVLPIVIYVCWAIWQGRGVRIPMSKLGMVHQVVVDGAPRDILVLPTSDVYLLDYPSSYDVTRVIREKPVIVIGTYKQLTNLLSVEEMLAYNSVDILPTEHTPSIARSTWESILRFISQFK